MTSPGCNAFLATITTTTKQVTGFHRHREPSSSHVFVTLNRYPLFVHRLGYYSTDVPVVGFMVPTDSTTAATRARPFPIMNRLYISTTQNHDDIDHVTIEDEPAVMVVTGSVAVRSQQPTETPSLTLQMLSFYHFEPLSDPLKARDDLFHAIKTIPGLRGTAYLAHEGINAQLAVPPGHDLDLLVSKIKETLPFNPFQNTHDGRPNLGDIVSIDTPTFQRLIVRTRDYILRDGINNDSDNDSDEENLTFDWTDSGPELSPEQWHEELSIVNDQRRRQQDVVMFDCRNMYESDEGTFEGAVPLNTNTFQESWDRLDELTENTPRETPVYIYCTGGIRCTFRCFLPFAGARLQCS
jgi:predicted sulfurtransferase